MTRLRLLLVGFALLLSTQNLAAQADTLGYSSRAPEWVGQFTTLSANVVLGGLTAGLFQELRGGSFKDGFTRGALGGAVIYGGKRLAAQRFYGAGLAGREVAAVGASIVRNASDGLGSLDRLILPVGITRVYWHRAQRSVSAKLDVYAAGMLAYAILEDDLDFDARETFSAGTAVFKTPNKAILASGTEGHAAGITRGGIILRADVPGWGSEFLERALAHERVHVLQEDQLFVTLNDQLDDWVFSWLGPAAPLSKYVDLNGTSEFLSWLAGRISRHADRPWEMESIYLTR